MLLALLVSTSPGSLTGINVRGRFLWLHPKDHWPKWMLLAFFVSTSHRITYPNECFRRALWACPQNYLRKLMLPSSLTVNKHIPGSLTQMNVVGVLCEHVVVVDELLRIRSWSWNADEAELSHDLIDVFVLPQSGSPERLEQISAAQQLQLDVRFWLVGRNVPMKWGQKDFGEERGT